MQLFSCPFCGARDETEFFFAGESGRQRPQPAGEVSAELWSQYLHAQDNLQGRAAEIWRHVTCGEYFVMERDTSTHEVHAVHALPHWSRT